MTAEPTQFLTFLRQVICSNLTVRALFLSLLFCTFLHFSASKLQAQIPPTPASESESKPEKEEEKEITLPEAWELFYKGEYKKCIEIAEQGTKVNRNIEGWWMILTKSQMATGLYPEAKESLEKALGYLRYNVGLRAFAYEVFRKNGNPEAAIEQLNEINRLVSLRPWLYSDPKNLTVIGRVALLLGADPKDILESFYDRAKKESNEYAEIYLAEGDLGLEKHDYEMAGNAFQKGLEKNPDHPELLIGLAKALQESDRKKAKLIAARVLELNPKNIPAHLILIDQAIRNEKYESADALLKNVLNINMRNREGWVYRAVLANVTGDFAAEKIYHEKAYGLWAKDPQVDYLLGKELAEKYRFDEAVTHLNLALKNDPNHLHAKSELATALLRTSDQSGWKLVDEVQKKDPYDVGAYNLSTLKEAMSKYDKIESEDFIIYMTKKEKQVYGPRLLELLTEAKQTLCKKYDITLEEKVTVEVFDNHDDFAIRTFGELGGLGYLGVCFGRVITANSPISQASIVANWEATFWHEFCHVVTLEKTRNRMPRWLSEGISVYEEKQKNPSWGQGMTHNYLKMIEEGELASIRDLSSSFLFPKSAMHVQFAYYQSSLVVEYLIEIQELEMLKRLLVALAAGEEINDAIERRYGEIDQLDEGFKEFVKKKIASYQGKGEWGDVPEDIIKTKDFDALGTWVNESNQNIVGLILFASHLIKQKKYDMAEPLLKKVIQLSPEVTDLQNPYSLLAKIYKETKQPKKEREILEQIVKMKHDALPSYLRLLELQLEAEDWKKAMETCSLINAVNPFIPSVYENLAEAAENLDHLSVAQRSLETWLHLNPENPPTIHLRLATLLKDSDPNLSKRHVLQALEEAPRYKEALHLLVQLQATKNQEQDISEKSPVKAEGKEDRSSE